jgi:hypothetical protein
LEALRVLERLAAMQNPFIQLSKYRAAGNDPQENRATEALAACLVLSEEMRREFLLFLFGETLPPFIQDVSNCEVSTQQQTSKGQWVDLLIEQEGEWSLVVEVKVKASEDGLQVESYLKWLRETRAGIPHVFTLVKNHDPTFKVPHCAGHHTWKKLYGRLSKAKNLSATDARIAEHFCNYLELEGIVSTWEPNQILGYNDGIKAKRALDSLFQQVATKLEDLNQGYLTETNRNFEWPALKVGRTSWRSTFGKGNICKLEVCYRTPVVWEEKDSFYLQILLWRKSHGCDWDFTKPKVARWIQKLRKENFDDWAILKGDRDLEKDILGYQFAEQPQDIGACHSNPSIAYMDEKEVRSTNESELVESMFQRVLQHCAVISKLS